MVDDEPVLTARGTMQQILRAVEGAIAKQSGIAMPLEVPHDLSHFSNFHDPPSSIPECSNTVSPFIHFNDLSGIGSQDMQALTMEGMSGGPLQTNTELNVFTTDLYGFLPSSIETSFNL